LPQNEYDFVIPGPFREQLDDYAQKYRHLPKDFKNFLQEFDHRLGRTIPQCGGAQKIRMRSSDKQKGKSGSFRIIYFLKRLNRVIFLDVYDKDVQADLTTEQKKRIRGLIEMINAM